MFSLHDPIDPGVRNALSAHDDLIAGLLARRGVTTAEEAAAFLNPSYDEHVHDPMLMRDMPEAAARLAAAIAGKERVTVWSDYDCDGIPGGVLLHDFLKKAGANFTNYIPHRHHEGYGVNVPGVEKLAAEGTRLLITVDSGITDVKPIKRARELGMDVILTDHHLPGETLPPANWILNPNAREEETYPFKGLCGAGVAWKLVCATLATGFPGRESIPEGWEKWLLDMAGFSTIADMVPLAGENRVLATYGLFVMRKSPRTGLQELAKQARVNQKFIAEEDVGFMLGPRINAASRMGDPRDAFSLLTSESQQEAERLARGLEALNRSRRAAAGAITRAVHDRIEKRLEEGKELSAVIAMGDPDWRPGLLGLVANGIADEYERPVFLWGREGNDTLKGSCRSGPGSVSVNAIMAAAGDALVSYGGHTASGGFSVAPDKVFTLEESLSEALRSLPEIDAAEALRADAVLAPEEATPELLKRLERLAPFGMKNEKPAFLFQDARIESVAWFGKAGEHLRIKVGRGSEEFPEAPLEAIAFYGRRELGKRVDALASGVRATFLAHLERDQFTRGQPIRLRLIALG
jgi:single-stranded-DNA-specific exonuclease